jgi:hypothetical protein
VTADTAEKTIHYHVLCIQDVGGSQEYGIGWDRKSTLAEAEEIARDAIEADRGNREGWYEGMPTYDELEARYRPKYGDDWKDLYSTNVNPGWEAIWIRPCDQDGECDIWCDAASRYDGHYPEPWWTPSRGERHPALVPLPWEDAKRAEHERRLRNAREYMLELDPEPRRELLTQMLAELS